MHLLEYGKNIQLGVNNYLNDKGNVESSFFYVDQTSGFVEFEMEAMFNRKFQNYLFVNSTIEQNGQNIYSAGNGRISEGNAKVVFRKIHKDEKKP